MTIDYTDLVYDMVAAYGADTFDWSTGHFTRSRMHNAGSFGWPWEFRHGWRIEAASATRDALIRRGLVEIIPDPIRRSEGTYRMSLAAMALVEDRVRSIEGLVSAPSMVAFRDAKRRAEAEKASAPGQTRTL